MYSVYIMKQVYRVLVLSAVFFFFIGNLLAQNASFNYSTSTGTIGTTYSWIDCSTGGTEITSFSEADDGHASVSWPFSFSFYDDNYTTSNSISVSTNGFIRLDGVASDNYSDASSYNLTSTATSFGQIICLGIYDDMTDQSNVYYKTTGTSPNRIFTIEYHNLEIDYNDNNYADIQVSFYETSNKIVIMFGADDVNRSGVDIGIHSGVNTFFDKWQDVDNGTNNAWIEYTIPAKSFNSITYNQASTADVSPSQANAEILRIDVDVNGGTGTLNLNSIQITANNDNNADIASSGVKLYRTTTTTFSTANLLGTAQSLSSGTATFSSLNYDLPGGTTYIWAVYDIASTGILNNDVDMTIAANAINIGGSTYPSSLQSPTGSREIVFIEWDGSTSTDWTVGSNWSGGNEPTSNDNIVIPSAPTNQPHVLNGDPGECKNLIIKSGAVVTIDATGEFDIYGDIDNEGTIASAGDETWLFGSNNYIKGSGIFTTFRVQVKDDKSYTLLHNISCDRMRVHGTGGTLNIGDYTLACSGDYNDNPNSDSPVTSTTNINNGTLSVVGVITLEGTLNPGTGTFFYNGSNTQDIVDKMYYSLKVKVSSGTRTLTNVSTNTRNLEITGAGTASLNANINIDGNIVNGSGCTINQNAHSINLAGDWSNSGTFTQGTQAVTFDGASSQTISGSTATTFYNLTANNSSGITLNKTTNVSKTLTLSSGIINTTSANMLILGTSATAVSGAGSTRYIDGPMRKDGSTDFVFPVGDAGKYARIGISSLSGSDNFTAEYHKTQPLDNTNYSYPITKVSDNESWDLINGGGSISATVTLYWEDSKWSGIGSFSDLRIMHYGSAWTAESGTYSNTGSVGVDAANAGTLSVTAVSAFSPFSFGTIDNVNNPLPIDLLSFDAQVDGDVVLINWKTATEENNDYFIIERSIDGEISEQIGRVQGAGNSNITIDYELVDFLPYSGISYYRLIQVDYDGQMETFDWVAVSYKDSKMATMDIYPNPTSDGVLNVSIHNVIGELQIVVYDISGREVYRKLELLETENQYLQLLLDLPSGIYNIQLVNQSNIMMKKLIVN